MIVDSFWRSNSLYLISYSIGGMKVHFSHFSPEFKRAVYREIRKHFPDLTLQNISQLFQRYSSPLRSYFLSSPFLRYLVLLVLEI
jgi:hypothetical protein